MTTDTQTLAAFVAEHGITLDVIDGPNYTRDEDGWEHHAYTLRLTMDGQTLDSPWRQGIGVTDDPTAEALLDSMASDSLGVDNARSFNSRAFDEWANELGYDPDSRKAEAIFRQCEAQRDRLAQWLGRESYDLLVYETERL